MRRSLAAPCSRCSASGYHAQVPRGRLHLARVGRLHLARVEIGTVLWRAWTHRSLTLSGPRPPAWLGPLRGKALEPLSHRDMWVLGRAARLARLANIPFSGLQRRHVVHWLRIPMDEQCVDSDTDDEEGLSDEDWSDLEGPSGEEWCRTAPAHLVPSNDELARRAARYMPGGDMYEPGWRVRPGSEIPRRTHLRPSVYTRGPCAPLVGLW